MRRRYLRLGAEGGFTLIELLVAMAAGLVVIAGATTLMMTGLHDSSQVTERVQAVQEGRTGMEELIQQLNSGCLVSDSSPVQASTAAGIDPTVASDQDNLVFVSGVGDSASPTPTEHVVNIQNGALVDTSYPYDGPTTSLDEPSTWAFSSDASQTQTLMEHAEPDGSNPIFQYFSYSNPRNATPNSLVGAQPLDVPLVADGAQANGAPNVAEVDIDVVTEAADADEQAGGSAQVEDAATFRLSTADPSDTNYPCA